jgi:hypothetical protein
MFGTLDEPVIHEFNILNLHYVLLFVPYILKFSKTL